ncbi:MAG: flagellar biosynthetic protein FliO [Planctomycetes bacterium]|nr:flagellar biosynthetic protein FliO [Planctomycetota bacterium]
MGLAAIVACIALAAAPQEAPADSAEVPLTLPSPLSSPPAAEPAQAPEAKPSAALAIPAEPLRPAPRPLEERPEPGPSVAGFIVGSFAVVGLLGGAFLLLKRFGKNSRLLSGSGAIQVLARKPIGQKQELLLIEAGSKVFLVGSTRDHLSALGEFASPDEVAQLRANLPARKDDSLRTEFDRSLREGLRGEEAPASEAPAKEGRREERVFASIADELAEIRKTVRAWRA